MRFHRAFSLAAILSLLVSYADLFGDEVSANSATTPEITATRIISEAPHIDGDLDEPFWKNHKFDCARDFRQMEPDEGDAATESTVVAVAYDDEALYVAFWCYDSEPDKIVQQLVRRDRWTDSDLVTVRIDPYFDHQTGYRFDINSAGVLVDFRLFNDTNSDRSWDGVWNAAAKIQPWGWSAEYKIPFSCIRFSKGDDQTWGLNVTRYIPRKQESSWWAFSPSTEGGVVSMFGRMHGLTGIKPTRHFEILPYAVSSLNTEPKHLGNSDGKDFFENTGVDLKYGISSDLVLDATINPDFGQVELDEPVLNLSSFETFYEEKRPFFLEGADLFKTSFRLFYSRRIGRSPRFRPNDYDYFTDSPNATTILGAGKLTGKLNEKTTLAVLSAFTQKETAKYIDVDGQPRNAVVEPMASYSVFRIQRNILRSSNIGIIGTLAGQNKRHPEITGGVDWRLYTGNGVWGTSGQVVASKVDPEKTGFGLDVALMKTAGKHIRGSCGINIKDPYLDLNGIGFLRRNSEREMWIWTQYRTQEDFFIIRNTWTNFNSWSSWNYEGDRTGLGWNINTNFQFLNGWSLAGGYNQNKPSWDDYETRGNGSWRKPSGWSWWSSFNTDSRRPVWLNINPGNGDNRYGSWWANYIGIGIRPQPNIELNIGANYMRGSGQTIWIANMTDTISGDVVPIFADLDQNEITPRITANINLTRDLSFQLSGQMLITALDYKNHRGYEGNEDYFTLRDDHFARDLSDEKRNKWGDGNYRAFNSTMVLRWEYRPGSTLYIVWTQARSAFAAPNNLEFGRDLRGVFSRETPADNVFLIKASYWLNI